MFGLEDLKSIILLSYLKDPMLKNIAKVTSVKDYSAGQYIFKEGEYAHYLCAIIEGKVGLEVQKSANMNILIHTLARGATFGYSAVVDTEEKKYTASAKALTDVKIYTWRGPDLEALFYKDYEMGFLFMKRIAKIIKSRLQDCLAQGTDMFR